MLRRQNPSIGGSARAIKSLAVVDNATREALAIVPELSSDERPESDAHHRPTGADRWLAQIEQH